MRPHEIFAAMPPEQSETFFQRLAEESPLTFTQALAGAATAMNSRPQYLLKQPMAKRVATVRRALSRVAAKPLAEEILAVYFLECRKELLTQWLDQLGLEHEDGVLEKSEPESPEPDQLKKDVEVFRGQDEDPDRELLLRAFASQSAIDWPALDALIAEGKS